MTVSILKWYMVTFEFSIWAPFMSFPCTAARTERTETLRSTAKFEGVVLMGKFNVIVKELRNNSADVYPLGGRIFDIWHRWRFSTQFARLYALQIDQWPPERFQNWKRVAKRKTCWNRKSRASAGLSHGEGLDILGKLWNFLVWFDFHCGKGSVCVGRGVGASSVESPQKQKCKKYKEHIHWVHSSSQSSHRPLFFISRLYRGLACRR